MKQVRIANIFFVSRDTFMSGYAPRLEMIFAGYVCAGDQSSP
jgi:hypothetical protein